MSSFISSLIDRANITIKKGYLSHHSADEKKKEYKSNDVQDEHLLE